MTEFGPALPLNCIDLANLPAVGLRCAECPLQEDDCRALAAGRAIIGQQLTIEGLQTEITERDTALEASETEKAHILERLFNLRRDTLIETAFSPGGLKDLFTEEAELQQELRGLQWGVVRLDGRFVGYINRFGNLVGDDFLQRGGARITAITDGLARFQNRRVIQDDYRPESERRQAERRTGFSIGQEDIICRQGGDEFSLIIRNVSPAQLASIAARVQSTLTVPYALERYAEGQIPFIASVGFGHALDKIPEVSRAFAVNDYFGAFSAINGFADDGQREVKSAQYREMWQTTRRVLPEDERDRFVMQPDDRVVAELFLRHLCPDFYRDPIAFLMENS